MSAMPALIYIDKQWG